MSLRTKFVLAAAVQTFLITLIVLVVSDLVSRRAINRQAHLLGSAVADAAVAAVTPAARAGDGASLTQLLRGLTASGTVIYADYVSAAGQIVAASDVGRTPAALREGAAVDGSLLPQERGLLFVRVVEGSGTLRLVVARAASRSLRELMAGYLPALAVALLLAIPLATVGSRFIVRPVLTVIDSASRISAGDLTQRTAVASGDEIGTLATAFNSMVATLERTFSRVVRSQGKLKSVVDTVSSRSGVVNEAVDRQSTVLDVVYGAIDELNSGIRKISDNVETLSASSEETSSSILEMVASLEEVSRHTDTLFQHVEETASATLEMVSSINEVDQNVDYLRNFVTDTSASMLEMSASIGEVEKTAARSSEVALSVADAAESGMRAVRETMEGMEHIRQSVHESNQVVARLGERSAAIGKILTVIEDVAEQTNLLALNASILAASAGEHGRGFSVVAAQIRELSERTASSTKEIASLIRSVQEEVGNALQTMTRGAGMVDSGVELAHEAGKALTNILESARNAAEMGKEIAGATREQAKGSQAVTEAIERVQDMVQQISAATNQQATGSEHILRAVEQMREVTRYVRQATVEQKSGSVMISRAAERMIDMVHEIFQVTADQAGESEKIVRVMEQLRDIAEANRHAAGEMNDSVALLADAIRELDEEVRRFRLG